MHLTRGWTAAAAFIARRAAGQGVRLLSSPGTEKEGGFARSQPLIGPTYIVWGAGTDIGKTLVSAAICNFLGRTGTTPGKAGNSIFYYKPVQTGFPEDSDADTVASVCGGHTEFGDHAGQLLAVSGDVASFPEILDLDPSVHLDVTARVEFAWSHPVSPHLAVKMEGRPVSDDELVSMMTQQLNTYSKEMALKAAGRQTKMYTLVETAGAVNSPAPSGRSQADIYRSLRLPGIMVGDGKIGGIASTISAMESLILRGMDISCVVMLDKGMGNERQIAEMLKSFKNYRGESVPVFVLPPIPKRRTERAGAPALRSWILQCHDKLKKIQDKLDKDHSERMTRMSAASELALSSLWWPFTQHALVNKVTVIDSRAGIIRI
jgi:dethiobiotin synthetase/adenosylmethionine--8-amino-7-oxononanoate aminotransferase